MMQLFDNPASPFCRKVMVTLRETGQLKDVEILHAVGHALAPQKMPTAQNPLGKIPTLVRADGPAMYDSRVICRFLDDRAKAGLYPERSIWDILTLEATADGIMEAAVLMVYEFRTRPEDKQFPDMVEGQWAKVTRALDAVEERWMGHLAGPLNMGQIAMGCALGYLDFRHADRDWRQGRNSLTDWYAKFSQTESMKATEPSA